MEAALLLRIGHACSRDSDRLYVIRHGQNKSGTAAHAKRGRECEASRSNHYGQRILTDEGLGLLVPFNRAGRASREGSQGASVDGRLYEAASGDEYRFFGYA
ncbi:hypothetical protein D3C73_1373300 [compost metagenome]